MDKSINFACAQNLVGGYCNDNLGNFVLQNEQSLPKNQNVLQEKPLLNFNFSPRIELNNDKTSQITPTNMQVTARDDVINSNIRNFINACVNCLANNSSNITKMADSLIQTVQTENNPYVVKKEAMDMAEYSKQSRIVTIETYSEGIPKKIIFDDGTTWNDMNKEEIKEEFQPIKPENHSLIESLFTLSKENIKLKQKEITEEKKQENIKSQKQTQYKQTKYKVLQFGYQTKSNTLKYKNSNISITLNKNEITLNRIIYTLDKNGDFTCGAKKLNLNILNNKITQN